MRNGERDFWPKLAIIGWIVRLGLDKKQNICYFNLCKFIQKLRKSWLADH